MSYLLLFFSIAEEPYVPRGRVEELPCERKHCPYGADCVDLGSGQATCRCPPSCPSRYEPLCGTDNVTYSNPCLMRKKVCEEKRRIFVKHRGTCGGSSRGNLFLSRCFKSVSPFRSVRVTLRRRTIASFARCRETSADTQNLFAMRDRDDAQRHASTSQNPRDACS